MVNITDAVHTTSNLVSSQTATNTKKNSHKAANTTSRAKTKVTFELFSDKMPKIVLHRSFNYSEISTQAIHSKFLTIKKLFVDLSKVALGFENDGILKKGPYTFLHTITAIVFAGAKVIESTLPLEKDNLKIIRRLDNVIHRLTLIYWFGLSYDTHFLSQFCMQYLGKLELDALFYPNEAKFTAKETWDRIDKHLQRFNNNYPNDLAVLIISVYKNLNSSLLERVKSFMLKLDFPQSTVSTITTDYAIIGYLYNNRKNPEVIAMFSELQRRSLDNYLKEIEYFLFLLSLLGINFDVEDQIRLPDLSTKFIPCSLEKFKVMKEISNNVFSGLTMSFNIFNGSLLRSITSILSQL